MKKQSIFDKFRYSAYSDPELQVSKMVKKTKGLVREREPCILDVGAGWGQHRDLLQKLGGRVYELDIQGRENLDILGDIYNLPNSSKLFDVVSLFMVLEHLHSPSLALEEVNRVLKKRGIVLLTTVQYWHTHGWPNDYYRYTRYGLQHLLEKTGFELIDCWSMGGPFLVAFHVLELNLGIGRRAANSKLFKGIYHILAFFFDKLDYLLFKHEDKRKYADSVGWVVIARKL